MTALVVVVAGASARAQFDPNRANDYYAARGSGTLATVERYHLGSCQKLASSGDWPRALGDCNFILRIFPNHPAALLRVAEICDRWKSSACLLDEVFDRAVAVNPKAPGTYVVQGIHLTRTRQYKSAIERFETALRLDPDNLNAHYNIALTYLDVGEFDLANRHAQVAYALGAPLPGLRTRLQQAGRWKPLDAPAAASAPVRATAPGAASGPAN